MTICLSKEIINVRLHAHMETISDATSSRFFVIGFHDSLNYEVHCAN